MTSWPKSKWSDKRHVVAHTTDGREITVGRSVMDTVIVVRWADFARIEKPRG